MKTFGNVAAAAVVAASLVLGTGASFAQNNNGTLTEPMDLEIGHEHTQILLEWNHVGVTTTRAVIHDFQGTVHVDPQTPANSHVSVTMDMNSFDSFFAPRDNVLKSARFFNVEAYPQVTFESTEIVSTGDKTAEMHGNMTILGQSHPVVFDVTFNKAAENMGAFVAGFDAVAKIDRGEVGLKDIYPNVAPEITVKISAELVKPKQ